MTTYYYVKLSYNPTSVTCLNQKTTSESTLYQQTSEIQTPLNETVLTNTPQIQPNVVQTQS